MIDLEKAKQEFIKFTNEYDLENQGLRRKYGHSLRVMKNSKEIAKSLNLSNEEIEIATLIGLLHDIGRFEQVRLCSEMEDLRGIDHGDLGVEILEKDSYIRKYIKDDEWDNIILKAIKNHNKYKIEDGLTEQEVLFCKIIRDADKLDIFYEGAEIFWENEEEKSKINNSTLTPEILREFKENMLIDRHYLVTPADGIVSFIGFIFDINFKYDFEVLKKEKYVDIILDKFNFVDEETNKQIESVRKIANSYINENIYKGMN